MKKITLALFAITFTLLFATPTFAVPKVTLPERSTWDADMINSDSAGRTGKGVYIAVLDTGLVPNWGDFFPQDRIATNLGIGFYQQVQVENTVTCDNIVKTEPLHTGSFIGSTGSTHGTHVVSTIIGYNYQAPADAAAGFPLDPLFIKGIAPDVTIIPVKVLDTYFFPCGPGAIGGVTFGTDEMVAAGIRYASDLTQRPMIISMSLGGPEPTTIIEDAINYAIGKGVIVVAAAGNAGSAGMDWPGAYPQVISAGAAGWKYEWYWPKLVAPSPPSLLRYRLWWLQDSTYGFNDVIEGKRLAGDVYVTDFSGVPVNPTGFSNCGTDHAQDCVQQLDVLAPGSWVRGPFEGCGDPNTLCGYSHLPWWSNGIAWLTSHTASGLTNFFYVGGTSMATPHVSAVAALMLEKNPSLTQSGVESILKATALSIGAGSMTIFNGGIPGAFYTTTWSKKAAGAGLIQADAAVSKA